MVILGLLILFIIYSLFAIGLILVVLGIVLFKKSKEKKIMKVVSVFCLIFGIVFCVPFTAMHVNDSITSSKVEKEMHKAMGPFLTAIDTNDYDEVKRLISKGTDVNKVYKINLSYHSENITPLILAIHKSDDKIVKLLLENGAEANKISGDRGYSTPLIEAIYSDYSNNNDNIKIIKLLLEHGADVKIRGGNKIENITPIEHSAWYSFNPEIMKLLIKYHSNVNIDNGEPLRAILISGTRQKEFDRLGFAKVLVENGANVDFADENGNTVLNYAISYGNLQMIKLFANHTKSINKKNKDGMTPLLQEVSYSEAEDSDIDKRLIIIKVFLKKGADINAKDNKGKTVLDYANMKNCSKIIAEYIKKNGAKLSKELK